MILPSKHTNFSESLLGFGSYLLGHLDAPKSVDDLWKAYSADMEKELYFAKHSFDNLVLTVLFLYSIGAVSEEKGVLTRCA